MGTGAQLGISEETTFGTYVAPTRFFEFVEESVTLDIARIESQGWRANQRVLRTGRWRPGRKLVAGDVTLELQSKSMGLFFKHAFGAIATTTPGGGTLSRDHTATLGNLRGKSLTLQVGRDSRDVASTVRPFSYTGVKIRRWQLSCALNQLTLMKMSIVGQEESTAQALATASYATAIEVFSFVEGTLTVGGAATPIKSVMVDVDNALADNDHALGSQLMREPLEPAIRNILGDFDADFVDLTAYNRFVNGTEATLVLLFQGSIIETTLRFQTEVTANVRFDGKTPVVSSPQEVRLSTMPFKVIAPTAGEPITAVYRTTDTAP